MAFDFPASPTVGQQFSPVPGVTYTWNGYGWAAQSPISSTLGPPQGRLTLQTATPVMTTTQAAKTTIFYTPYVGNLVPIYDGTNFSMVAFSELSALTTDTTKSPAAIGVSKVNDWFVWNDAGTIRVGHGPDWTSDTTRSAGTALTRVNGIWLNAVAITNGPAALRGTYVGTTRSNGLSQLDWIYGSLAVNWGAGFLGVWNAYNRVNVATRTADSTDNWTYATPVWRAANGNATARISFVIGLEEDAIDAVYYGAASGSSAQLGVGLDSTTVFSGTAAWSSSSIAIAISASYRGTVGVGFHYVSPIEYNFSGTSTFYGDASLPLVIQTGFYLTVRM
jgi:hypothetical protein